MKTNLKSFPNESQIIGPQSTINIISPVLSFSVMMEAFFCIYFAVGKQEQGLQLLSPQHNDINTSGM